jgi:hypothetical protein
MFDVAGGADELVDFGFATVTRRFLRDRNDPPPLRYGVASGHRRFDGRRLGLVGDQLAQERNQHDERNTIRLYFARNSSTPSFPST